jgi:hypothetical protein
MEASGMRTMEFRAWNKKTQQYDYLADCVKDDIVLTLPSCKVEEVSEWSGYGGGGIETKDVSECYDIEQFTGLTDRGGVKIQEGDIFRAGDDGPVNVVIMRHGCFGYEVPHGFVPLGLNHHYFDLTTGAHQSHVIKIIGNIHENPELLAQREQT